MKRLLESSTIIALFMSSTARDNTSTAQYNTRSHSKGSFMSNSLGAVGNFKLSFAMVFLTISRSFWKTLNSVLFGVKVRNILRNALVWVSQRSTDFCSIVGCRPQVVRVFGFGQISWVNSFWSLYTLATASSRSQKNETQLWLQWYFQQSWLTDPLHFAEKS